MAETGSEWESLKKAKIKENVIKIIDLVKKDNLIDYRILQKQKYLEEKRKTDSSFQKKNRYIWNEFRPPLQLFSIDNETFSKFDISKIIDKLNDSRKNMATINQLILSFLKNEEKFL